jgi:hypothetical protein
MEVEPEREPELVEGEAVFDSVFPAHLWPLVLTRLAPEDWTSWATMLATCRTMLLLVRPPLQAWLAQVLTEMPPRIADSLVWYARQTASPTPLRRQLNCLLRHTAVMAGRSELSLVLSTLRYVRRCHQHLAPAPATEETPRAVAQSFNTASVEAPDLTLGEVFYAGPACGGATLPLPLLDGVMVLDDALLEVCWRARMRGENRVERELDNRLLAGELSAAKRDAVRFARLTEGRRGVGDLLVHPLAHHLVRHVVFRGTPIYMHHMQSFRDALWVWRGAHHDAGASVARGRAAGERAANKKRLVATKQQLDRALRAKLAGTRRAK